MSSLFTELRRRSVFKVGAAYAIVAWLLIQVADVVLPTFNSPEWVMQVFTFFMILGFPVALLLAWAYELTPQGIKSASSVEPADGITHVTGQRLNYVILGLVVLAVGFLVTDQYLLDRGMRASLVPIGNSRMVTTADSPTPPAPETSGVVRSSINIEASEPIGDTGLSAHVAISPDGRQLVYAAQADGSTQLYLRALDQFATRPIPGTEGAFHPFFSPDGDWVGFYTEQVSAPSLKRVLVRGGLPQTLTRTVFSAGGSWEVDDTIIFGTGGGGQFAGRNLYRIPAVGGAPEELLVSDNDRGYVTPEVLPGGEAVLFVARPGQGGSGNARDGSISVLSLATKEVRALIEGGYRPQYAPTGHIVFVRGDALWAVPFDAERLEITGPQVPVLEGVQNDGFRGAAAYAFSDDGTLVYMPGRDVLATGNLRSLVWVDRQGNEAPLEVETLVYNNPRISPDGRQLAVSILEGANRDVWVYDLTRNTTSRLTFDTSTDDHPIWTPDGDRIVFHSTRDGGGMFSKAANGTGAVSLVSANTGTPREPLSYSPDGNQIVFRETVYGWDLRALSTDDEPTVTPLLESAFNEVGAAVSPDGRWLAYDSNETGQYEVYVRPFPNVDGGKWQISRSGGNEPLWGPDGMELFYRQDGGGVMRVPVETDPNFTVGPPSLVFEGSYADIVSTSIPSYDISPDGERFLMLKFGDAEDSSVRNQLRLVYNWFEELERLAPPDSP